MKVQDALREVQEAQVAMRDAQDRFKKAKCDLAEALGINEDLIWTGAISFNYHGIKKYLEWRNS